MQTYFRFPSESNIGSDLNENVLFIGSDNVTPAPAAGFTVIWYRWVSVMQDWHL